MQITLNVNVEGDCSDSSEVRVRLSFATKTMGPSSYMPEKMVPWDYNDELEQVFARMEPA